MTAFRGYISNKYSAKKTYSELCGRTFDSKAEARRGEELALLEKDGQINNLQYQVQFQLCLKPTIKLKVDFAYKCDGQMIYEDTKGVLTREFRVKMAWLEQAQGIKIILTKSAGVSSQVSSAIKTPQGLASMR